MAVPLLRTLILYCAVICACLLYTSDAADE